MFNCIEIFFFFFRSRSGIGNDQRFMELAKLHGLSHLIKKN